MSTFLVLTYIDMNVLRIEGLPSNLPSRKTQGSTLPSHIDGPPATTPVSAPYMFSPTPSTLPQPAPGMPIQYLTIQSMSPTRPPLLPATQGGVSYVVSDKYGSCHKLLISLMWLEEHL